ncbi:MAG: polysaccharide biosynthesis protein [Aggregatilineales bacterium]
MNRTEQQSEIYRYLAGRRVLVTGGTGSVGTALVRQLLQQRVAEIKILSRNTDNHDKLRALYADEAERLVFVQGSVESEETVNTAMQGVDIVYHVAAMKHIPGCENDPIKATMINVLGSNNIFMAACASETVKKVVAVSTDKAISPDSVMGASKIIMERTALKYARELREAGKAPAICIVRPGNVMASQGSVLPFFLRQIKAGGPVTVTHDEMTRFVMTIPETANLLIKAAADAQGGEIYIKQMGSLRIYDLARVMVSEIAPLVGHDPAAMKIKIVGPRPGETFHEELVTDSEHPRTVTYADMYKIYPQYHVPDDAVIVDKALLATKTAPAMTDNEIIDLLRRLNYLDVTTLREN